MIFGLFTLAVAIFISGVSAFYSVTGLTAIFAAAFWPIVIMGGALELGKITATVWLHKYWNRAGWQFKTYLVPAIVILMLITSMGTFGYLSAAHLSQSTANEDISSQVSLLDEKIKTEQDNIATSKQALKQMDAQVDQLLGRTDDDKGANRAVQVRKQQAKERKSLQADISIAQKNISTLQAERAPIAAKSRVAESHIGPIKYIAALIYGDNPNADLLERAVRWVIILLVFVFDPLALILILAAEQTIAWARDDKEKRKGWHQEWVPDTEAWPEWDDEITEEQIEAIKQEANVDNDIEMTSFFDEGKELAKEIDANNGYLNKPWAWPSASGNVGLVAKEPLFISRIAVPESNPDVVVTLPEEPAEIKKPEPELNGIAAEDFIDFITANTVVAENPEPVASIPVATVEEVAVPARPKPQQRTLFHHHLANTVEEPEVVHHPDKFDPEPIIKPRSVDIPSFAISEADNNPVDAGFGTEFPPNPNKGDMFLRVDMLPSKLFKWNEKKWIEVDKTKTDSFAYDAAYIQHLIEKIDSGEYDVDMLSVAEQEQISRYLNNDKPN